MGCCCSHEDEKIIIVKKQDSGSYPIPMIPVAEVQTATFFDSGFHSNNPENTQLLEKREVFPQEDDTTSSSMDDDSIKRLLNEVSDD